MEVGHGTVEVCYVTDESNVIWSDGTATTHYEQKAALFRIFSITFYLLFHLLFHNH